MAEGLVNKLELTSESELDFSKGERAYEGMSGRTKLVVRIVNDSLFVSRNYWRTSDSEKKPSEGIRIKWSFNKNGRIRFVKGILIPEGEYFQLLEIEGLGELSENWNKAGLIVYDFPSRINLVNHDFIELPLLKKLESLMIYGHTYCRELNKNIRSGNIRESYSYGRTTHPLILISDDEDVVRIINQAGSIFPYVYFDKTEECYKINYQPETSFRRKVK